MAKEPKVSLMYSNQRSRNYNLRSGKIKRFNKTSTTWRTVNDSGDIVLKTRTSSFSYSLNVLGIVVVVLLIGTVSSVLGGGEPKTLYSLLLSLQNCPTISTDWLNWAPLDLGNLGGLEFLANIIELLYGAVNLILFAGVSLLNLFPFIKCFLSWLFF